jgi:5-methylcytosine-specific restriction endonuclease McrA
MGKGLYSYRWDKARKAFLKQHPLCAMHQHMGQVVAATVVDHIIPHKGDTALFWDRTNWQPLCKLCHDSTKQRLEKQADRLIQLEPKPKAWGG